MNHPNRESLALLAYGLLDSSEEAAARTHLAECASCRADWSASRGEASAVKAAFEPAPTNVNRVLAWWPALVGLAAALLLGLALPDGDSSSLSKKPAMHRVSSSISQAPMLPGLSVTGEWAGAQIRTQTANEIGLDGGRILVAFRGTGSGSVVTPAATLFLGADSSWLIDVQDGETRVVCREGYGHLGTGNSKAELRAGDAAAVGYGTAPVVVGGGTDPAPRLAALRGRIAALELRIASLPANAEAVLESPEDVGRWLARAAANGRKLETDAAMSDTLARLWSREIRKSGVSAREIEAGPARERLLAGYFEVRAPFGPEKQHAWEALIRQHEAAWTAFLHERKSLSGFERALAAARVAERRGPKYDSLLEYGQTAAVAELDAAFRDWRRGFAPVFEIVVGTGGPEKALEAAAGPGGMPAPAVPIMREHLEACLALHADFKGSGDPAGEQVSLIVLLIKTRDRLFHELGYSLESASARVVNFVEGASK